MTVLPARGSPSVDGSRLERFGMLHLIVGSAWPTALFTVSGLTFTGDRLLGLTALPVLAVLGLRGRVRWTLIHMALATSPQGTPASTVLTPTGPAPATRTAPAVAPSSRPIELLSPQRTELRGHDLAIGDLALEDADVARELVHAGHARL